MSGALLIINLFDHIFSSVSHYIIYTCHMVFVYFTRNLILSVCFHFDEQCRIRNAEKIQTGAKPQISLHWERVYPVLQNVWWKISLRSESILLKQTMVKSCNVTNDSSRGTKKTTTTTLACRKPLLCRLLAVIWNRQSIIICTFTVK